MASPDTARSRPSRPRARRLFSLDMLLVAWLPVLLIGVAHYVTGSHHHWVHDVLRRLYYVPILLAAFMYGVRGGLAVSILSSLTYAPHAFVIVGAHDPATTLNKTLEIVLYNVIGLVAGLLADREARRTREAERSLAEERRMAEQLVRAGRLAALGELVAGIAHEIKNPLHTIKGTAEILDDIVPKNQEQSHMWPLLRQEVERLEGIAERFLSFARPSRPDLKPHTFGDVYERTTELLRAHVHGTPKVRLDVLPLPEDLARLVLHVDRDQVAQIALNIAGNAVSAMHEAGALRVVAGHRQEESAAWATLRFENDGPIIAENDLERIFDPFHTRSAHGTGLGLAIAGRIAEGHNALLEVSNTGDVHGVAFTLALPLTGRA